jgi:hypothetical protein
MGLKSENYTLHPEVEKLDKQDTSTQKVTREISNKASLSTAIPEAKRLTL